MNVLNLKQKCKCGNDMVVVRIEPLYVDSKYVDTNLVFRCDKCYKEVIESQNEICSKPWYA